MDNVNDIPIVLTKETVLENPSVIGESIVKLSEEIVNSREDLSMIHERDFFQRLTNNNIRDIAKGMIKQNEINSMFLTVMQGVIFLGMNNVMFLGAIMNSLEKHEKESLQDDEQNSLRDNQYFTMAKEFLSESIEAAQRASDNEHEIKVINDRLSTFGSNHDNQKRELAALQADSKQQTNRINQMEVQQSTYEKVHLKTLKRQITLSFCVGATGVALGIIAIIIKFVI